MNSPMRNLSPRVAIILAGGEGVRLRSVTRFITGQDEMPKQFCPMVDGLTWLENTRNRVAHLIPVERSLIVVKQSHRRFYEPLLGDLPRSQIVAQPCDRGTAPAILYGILRAKRTGPEPDPSVSIFPSDHYVSDDAGFMRQVERAFHAVDTHPALAVLLGMRPDRAETSYGWIEPAARLSPWTPDLFRVKRFWEKPGREFARTLLASGCLWNSGVVVARASVLEAMIEEQAPAMVRSFHDAFGGMSAGDEERGYDPAYAKLEPVGFSEHILSRTSSNLTVQLVDDIRWSDLGEPERLIDTLQTLKSRPAWLENLAREYGGNGAGRTQT
jgi:mannose-1-phosphate guanylyltransferase